MKFVASSLCCGSLLPVTAGFICRIDEIDSDLIFRSFALLNIWDYKNLEIFEIRYLHLKSDVVQYKSKLTKGRKAKMTNLSIKHNNSYCDTLAMTVLGLNWNFTSIRSAQPEYLEKDIPRGRFRC